MLQETGCFFRTVCKSVCVYVWWGPVCSASARKLNRSPGSETSCSFSEPESYVLTLSPQYKLSKKAKWLQTLFLPVSRFAFLPLFLPDMSKKSVTMLWFIHCLTMFFSSPLTRNKGFFSHPNNQQKFTQKQFWGYTIESYKNNTKFPSTEKKPTTTDWQPDTSYVKCCISLTHISHLFHIFPNKQTG